jgi:hypothetical protein
MKLERRTFREVEIRPEVKVPVVFELWRAGSVLEAKLISPHRIRMDELAAARLASDAGDCRGQSELSPIASGRAS